MSKNACTERVIVLWATALGKCDSQHDLATECTPDRFDKFFEILLIGWEYTKQVVERKVCLPMQCHWPL